MLRSGSQCRVSIWNSGSRPRSAIDIDHLNFSENFFRCISSNRGADDVPSPRSLSVEKYPDNNMLGRREIVDGKV